MLVFPQLSTGTVALYPVRRTRRVRTVQNAMADGSVIVYSDADFGSTEWDLDATGLTGAEYAAIEALFEETRGPEGTFTFLEPAGNLLARSESFSADEWDNSALMTVASGLADPWGSTRASSVTNSAPVMGWLGQTLPVPGDFQYALSVWVRSGAADVVTLFADATGGNAEQQFSVGTAWRRVSMPVALGAASESVRFGARLAAGKTVELVGFQVDAQPGAGGYQRTFHKNGVHSKARFAMDELKVRARSEDVFDCAVRIVSKGN